MTARSGILVEVAAGTGWQMGERSPVREVSRQLTAPVVTALEAAIFDQMTEAVAVFATSGALVYANLAGGRLLGRAGAGARDAALEHALERVLASREPARLEHARDGRWFDSRVCPLPVGACVICRDVTAEKLLVQAQRDARSALRTTEERLRLVVEAAEVGTWELFPQSGRLVWSERSQAMFGRSSGAEASLGDLLEAIHPDDRARVVTALAAATDSSGDGALQIEFRVFGLEDGVERTLHVQGRCLFDAGGRPARFAGIDLDVSARRADADRSTGLAEAGAALARSPDDLGAALRGVARAVAGRLGDVCSVSVVEEGGETLVARAVEVSEPELERRIAPWRGGRVSARDGLAGEALRAGRALRWDDPDATRVVDRRAAGALGTFAVDERVFGAIAAPIRLGGRSLGVLGCARHRPGRPYVDADLVALTEIADRVAQAIARVEQAAQAEAARARLQAITDALPVLISFVGRDHRYQLLNRAYETWFGRAPDAFVGCHVRDMVGDAVYQLVRPRIDAVLAGAPQEFESRLPYRDGGPRDVRVIFVPLADDDGATSGFASLVVDVTSEHVMVENLQRTLHFAELLVGVVGHDLRNPLAAITSGLGLLELELGTDGRSVAGVHRMMHAVDRMARMIDQLLDLTRVRLGTGIELEPCEIDLGALARGVLEELEPVAASRAVTLEVVGDVRGRWDPDRLAQVLSNLAANALRHGDRAAPITVRIDGRTGSEVVVEVANRGAMPAAQLPQVFEPFHAHTDPAGRRGARGLGLGLFISKHIVTAHGGAIVVHSTEAAGTRFTIRLPRSAGR